MIIVLTEKFTQIPKNFTIKLNLENSNDSNSSDTSINKIEKIENNDKENHFQRLKRVTEARKNWFKIVFARFAHGHTNENEDLWMNIQDIREFIRIVKVYIGRVEKCSDYGNKWHIIYKAYSKEQRFQSDSQNKV